MYPTGVCLPPCPSSVLSSACYLEFAFQEGDCPEIWPAANTFAVIGTTTITAGGITPGNNGFEAITLTKAYVRSGILIRNNNQGPPKYKFVWVATRFDTRSC